MDEVVSLPIFNETWRVWTVPNEDEEVWDLISSGCLAELGLDRADVAVVLGDRNGVFATWLLEIGSAHVWVVNDSPTRCFNRNLLGRGGVTAVERNPIGAMAEIIHQAVPSVIVFAVPGIEPNDLMWDALKGERTHDRFVIMHTQGAHDQVLASMMRWEADRGIPEDDRWTEIPCRQSDHGLMLFR